MKRRTFFKALGLGAAAAALPWWLRAPRAHAGPKGTPKRVVFFYTGGSVRGLWEPVAPAGQPEPTEKAFELGELHAPLAAFKEDLIVLDGLDMISADRDNSAAAEPHSNGATHALAAIGRAAPTLPGGPSIDQVIAAKLNEVPQTALRSLELVGSGSAPDYNLANAYGAGQLVPQIWDPRAAYARLFPPVGDYARDRSVLDFVDGEAAALAKRLGGEDRQKVEQHRDNLRDLETRLGIGLANEVTPLDPAILAPLDGVSFSADLPPDVQVDLFEKTTDLHIRLLVAALAADLTRVATLTVQAPPDPMVGYHPGDYGAADLHSLQHMVATPTSPVLQIPEAVAMVKEVHLIQAGLLAKLLDALKAVKEPDGATLLDNTVVLWCGEIAEAEHDLHGLPWLLAGSCGGYFETGRYLKLPRDAEGRGLPHNDLFVSLANAMDVPITTFGDPECCNGPLAGLGG